MGCTTQATACIGTTNGALRCQDKGDSKGLSKARPVNDDPGAGSSFFPVGILDAFTRTASGVLVQILRGLLASQLHGSLHPHDFGCIASGTETVAQAIRAYQFPTL
jgi:hypothetical protein